MPENKEDTMKTRFLVLALVSAIAVGCGPAEEAGMNRADNLSDIQRKLAQYDSVRLTTDLSRLSRRRGGWFPC